MILHNAKQKGKIGLWCVIFMRKRDNEVLGNSLSKRAKTCHPSSQSSCALSGVTLSNGDSVGEHFALKRHS